MCLRKRFSAQQSAGLALLAVGLLMTGANLQSDGGADSASEVRQGGFYLVLATFLNSFGNLVLEKLCFSTGNHHFSAHLGTCGVFGLALNLLLAVPSMLPSPAAAVAADDAAAASSAASSAVWGVYGLLVLNGLFKNGSWAVVMQEGGGVAVGVATALKSTAVTTVSAIFFCRSVNFLLVKLLVVYM